ncbi:MAG: PepSY-like domain-containing protein [Flavitalea sp.]
MKKNISLILCIAFFSAIGTSAFAQFRKIPADVTDAFAQKFAGATKVEWRDKLTGYSANFEQEKRQFLVNYNNKAEWESTEEIIEDDALPSEVRDGFSKSKYSDWNISKVNKIELPNNEIQYRVMIASGDIKKRNLYFSVKGKMLKDKLTI